MTIQLGANLTILTDGFNSQNGLSVQSVDGHHSLTIVVPANTPSAQVRDVSFSANTVQVGGSTISVSTPGRLTVGDSSTLSGTVSAGSLSGWGAIRLGSE